MSEIHDSCGVVAFARLNYEDMFSEIEKGADLPDPEVARWLYSMLLNIQHRGQLSAGITTYDPRRIVLLRTHKALGMVSRAFARDKNGIDPIEQLDGVAGIGHIRYATCGVDDEAHAQPFERWHGRPWKWFSICFNGTITNFGELKEKLVKEQKYHLIHDTDTEVILHYLAYAHRGTRRPSFTKVFAELASRLDGAYSIAFLNALGDIVMARDPLGFRPLCFGVQGNLWAAASESIALTNLGFEKVEFIEPGTLLHVNTRTGKILRRRFAESRKKAHCFFEWVYFSSAGSVLDGRSVYLSRAELGRELATIERARWQEAGISEADKKDWIVVPVPDAAKAAADAMAYELNIPCLEGLLRNRYVGRTFIEKGASVELSRRKYTPLPEVLNGKKILLVEDSIVRLNTLRAVIDQMRSRSVPKEIHVRITCPPIIGPCFYGIDMPTCEELYAYQFLRKPAEGLLPEDIARRMAQDMKAESLVYLPVESIPRCVGLPREDLCMACVTGCYPTHWGQVEYDAACAHYEKEHGPA